ncbi:DUF4336 domain-containing protein [Mesorhizobium sp. CAU 1741]|uniref:DUF4336 domain-containing protein n=1 Tax=Mesorhizobium sp. CAU 1741 TaxID=3140366 RepID=UPI00325B743C
MAGSGSMLQRFGDEIWIADGPNVMSMGFRYPSRMTIIRLDDGTLFVWSPVAMNATLKAEVEALGTVKHVVAPNSLHHVFLGEWASAFPDAHLYAAPQLRSKCPEIKFDHDLGDVAPDAWVREIDQVAVPGNAITTEVVFFHKKSATVLFTDLIQQFPEDWFSGWRRFVAKWDLMVSREATVPRKFRIAFTDRKLACAALRRILEWPADKVLMAHGAPVMTDGRNQIARAFAWLKP